MFFSLFVTAREGLEMALIITILLGYLRSIDQKQHFRDIWYGVGAATALSIAFGAGLKIASRELDGRILEAFEGFTMLFAVAVLTWMLFWMQRQSAGISGDLKHQIDRALSRSSVAALVLLAFSSVGREGFETALFLFAGSTNQGSDLAFALGGVLGFGLAAVFGVIIYYGAARLPLKHFFLASGVVLMVLAAGLVSNGIAELHEATIMSNVGSRPWDTETFISMTSDMGKFLHTLFGYDSAPAMLQIVMYWGYLGAVLSAYFVLPNIRLPRRSVRERQAAAAAVTTES
jgi:high-affinity iron transporter